MSDDLHRLVYVSRNLIDGDTDVIAGEIGTVLDLSRTRNVEDGITGALMFSDGCFAQVLEGPLEAIQETFERIQCDERHDRVRLLGLDPVDARGFGDWSMAYVGRSESTRSAFAALSADGAFDPDSMPPERIYDLLREHLADAERGASRHAA